MQLQTHNQGSGRVATSGAIDTKTVRTWFNCKQMSRVSTVSALIIFVIKKLCSGRQVAGTLPPVLPTP